MFAPPICRRRWRNNAYLHGSSSARVRVAFDCLPRIAGRFPRAGGRFKGRVAPAGGAEGALDAATREWIMGRSGARKHR
jgi:hypothetical protein